MRRILQRSACHVGALVAPVAPLLAVGAGRRLPLARGTAALEHAQLPFRGGWATTRLAHNGRQREVREDTLAGRVHLEEARHRWRYRILAHLELELVGRDVSKHLQAVAVTSGGSAACDSEDVNANK